MQSVFIKKQHATVLSAPVHPSLLHILRLNISYLAFILNLRPAVGLLHDYIQYLPAEYGSERFRVGTGSFPNLYAFNHLNGTDNLIL